MPQANAAHGASPAKDSGVSGGRLRSVVIDRCFVDRDGVRWVVDYKTSAHEGGGLEEFLDQWSPSGNAPPP